MTERLSLSLLTTEDWTLFGFLWFALAIIGVLSAIHAVMNARSGPAAIAWSIVLMLEPLIALPLYWVFGRRKFAGYVKSRREGNEDLHPLVQELEQNLTTDMRLDEESKPGEVKAMELLATMPFTTKNDISLLIDGKNTFDAIFASLEKATDYILIQFYIFQDDTLGRELKDILKRKAADGVRIYFLYDQIGCHALPEKYLADLRKGVIHVAGFKTTFGPTFRFQINFRNHRKLVVIDGKVAFVGGLNVGDKYLGKNPKYGHWRDTHLCITGPAVQSVQLTFVEDWYWARGEVPEMSWQPVFSPEGDKPLLVLPTGPADKLDTCLLFFIQAINSAKKRVWITSPYFVPNDEIKVALRLAVLRGVDVRILLPERTDHTLVHLAGFTYYPTETEFPVRLFRYKNGFHHQKAVLIDDDLAAIGSANLDHRSFHLNFEIMIIAHDKDFAAEVTTMLEEDFSKSTEILPGAFDAKPFWFRLAAHLARLFSPVL